MRAFVMMLAGLLAVAVCGCSSASYSGPTLQVVGDSHWGSALNKQPAGHSIVLQVSPLCTTGKPITVDKVTIDKPTGGIRLTGWGVRPSGDGVPASVSPQADDVYSQQGTVSVLHSFGHKPVSAKCVRGNPVTQTEFVISMKASSSTRATMKGVWVTYNGGQRLFVFWDVALCPTKKCATFDLQAPHATDP